MRDEGLVQLNPGISRPGLWGCNTALRRRALAAIGPFTLDLGVKGNEQYHGEDTDMIRGAMLGGLKVLYDSRLVVWRQVPRARMRKSYFRRGRFQAAEGEALAQGPPAGRRRLRVSLFAYRLVASRLAARLAAALRLERNAFLLEPDLMSSVGRWGGDLQTARRHRHCHMP